MKDETRQPGIQISQVFLEKAEFSHRGDALALPPNTSVGSPTMSMQFEAGVQPDNRVAFVRVRAHTVLAEQPLYNIDVMMTALVEAPPGQENMPLQEYVMGSGPAMVYSFVRQMVADLTWRGRFGPIWLPPTNVRAVLAGVKPTLSPSPLPAPTHPSRSSGKGRRRRSTRKRKASVGR
jgi:preprotein translocase subunit SecB